MIHWRKNIIAKLISVVAAIFLWFFVMNEQNPIMELNVTVPVEAVGLSDTYIVQDMPETVRITLRGPRNTIIRLDQLSLKARLDLSNVIVGKQIIPINFTPPPGLTVTTMDPINATINVDEYAVRQIPVEMKAVGKLPDIMGIKTMKIVPTTVTVSGARTSVDAVAHAYIRAKLDDRNADFTSRGNIEVTDAAGNDVPNVTVTPYQGDLMIWLERIRFDKTVSVVVPTTGTVAAGYKVKAIDVQPKQVVISGKQNDVQSITAVDTDAVAIDGIASNLRRIVKIPAINGVTIAPETVTVTVEVESNGLGNTGGTVINATNN